MSKKKKREERNNGIRHAVHEIVRKMMPSFHAIENKKDGDWPKPEKKKKEKKTPRYKELVIKIVDSVENKRNLDREAFNELIGMHPHLEPIVKNMITQVELFSIYDLEPMKINFDYSLWLKKIKIKLEA